MKRQIRKLTLGLMAIILLAILMAVLAQFASRFGQPTPTAEDAATTTPTPTANGVSLQLPNFLASAIEEKPSPTPAPIVYVGPREGIPEDAPLAYGFWSFAQPVAGVFSRSGQPLIGEFQWLKQQGWKGVIDLRVDGERDEVGDDSKIPGFTDLGFNYLYVPISDGHPPTNEEADQILTFMTNPANQPLHVHCRGGIGRAGTVTALYRYAVQGWPIDDAIKESRPFQGGISSVQEAWLRDWATTHEPGSYAK